MSLIQDTATLKQFIPVSAALEFSSIQPDIDQAERDYIIPLIGQSQYNDLESSISSPTTNQAKLLKIVRRPLAQLAAWLFLPKNLAVLDDSGLRVQSNSDNKLAPEWSYEARLAAHLDQGSRGLDAMLEFLESNSGIYPIWANSSNCTTFRSNFIRTATEFSDCYNIRNSRRTFLSMKATMNKVELKYIQPILGAALFDDIKSELGTSSVSSDNNKLLSFIRPAIAHLVAGIAMGELAIEITPEGLLVPLWTSDSEKARKTKADNELYAKVAMSTIDDGKLFLKQLKDYLEANNSTYPLYPYIANANTTFENPSDTSVFMV